MTDELIAINPVFAQLSAAHRALLADGGIPVSFRAGERLFAEGGPADKFWLIDSGSVALDMQVPGRGEQVIETLVGRTVLGWSWLHPPYRWHFGAVAREQTTAVAFDAVSVGQRCADDPAFGYAIMCCFTPIIIERLMATRLRVLDLYAAPAQAGRPATEVPS
ncbi:cyclic nucleotide-binding domain-containing protein [Actinoplanes sp. KI2]|uniref:cyclic nucleotide-binding domain-containing protein n=1 Tax=Actinoplanes sp. KI2 TaxID=2983315 RepID=UPI0021D5CE22|nr:cyclic nucleotide-binding domain-containing protein [Actinoplanes sp. KI2]MCU7729482.1 cyclic nucleotide-binding domain-containing protein [Actinoplanes sp. KI2]